VKTKIPRGDKIAAGTRGFRGPAKKGKKKKKVSDCAGRARKKTGTASSHSEGTGEREEKGSQPQKYGQATTKNAL